MRFPYNVFACLLVLSACGTTDTTPPAPPIVDPVSSPTPVATIEVTGSAEFGAKVTIEGGAMAAGTFADPYTARWFAKVTLAPGANTLRVTAEDAAGNTSAATSVEITQGPLGTVAPFTLALQLAQPSAFVGVPLGFAVIAVDARGNPADQATLQVTSSDTTAAVSLPNRTITFNTPGGPAHTITATLFAGTANKVTASASIFVSAITNQPPTVVITSPAAGSIAARDFTVTVRASDPAGLAQIYLQATGAADTFQQQLVPVDPVTGKPPLGPYTTTFTVPVGGGAIGPATLVAQATDIYGNAMTSLAVTVNIDPARSIIVGAGLTVSTVSARGLLRRPQGVAVGPANFVYVTNNDSNFPLIVKIDPAGLPLSNQTTLVTAQPGHNGEDLVFTLNPAPAFFVSTSGIDRIARVDAAGTNLSLGWSQNVGSPAGLVVESATSVAAIYRDNNVRRFDATAAGPNTVPTSSMNMSASLAGSWGLELLSPGCRANQYQCGNGNCIANTSVCNAVDNCGDGTDEGAVTCAAAASFKCKAGLVTSTPVVNICSGRAQCADASDEAGCSRYAATDGGANDQTWSFYDNGNGAATAFDLLLDPGAAIAEPRGIARSPGGGFVYVASRGGNAIYKISTADILARTPCPGGCPTVATGFDEAYGLAFGTNGDLLVTDRAANLVYRITGLP